MTDHSKITALNITKEIENIEIVLIKKYSTRVGEGKGLFLKRYVKAKTVITFYNGVRLAGLEPEGGSWEDKGYRIMVGEDARMDIPSHMRILYYTTTLLYC